jgi:hypothetical protein
MGSINKLYWTGETPPKPRAGGISVCPLCFECYPARNRAGEKNYVAFCPSRRFNGLKDAQRKIHIRKKRVFDNRKNGFLDVCVGNPTDFTQDLVTRRIFFYKLLDCFCFLIQLQEEFDLSESRTFHFTRKKHQLS